MTGERLIAINQIDINKIEVITNKITHIFRAVGNGGAKAEVKIMNVTIDITKNTIRQVSNWNNILSIITDSGCVDIKIEIQNGVEGWFEEIFER